MKIWTAHLHEAKPPVLLREGFSWGAFLFGPFWLAARRAWIPAGLTVAVHLLIALLARDPLGPILGFMTQWCLGLWGNDLCRWSLTLRGYLLAHVLAARDEDAAFCRLLDTRPDLAEFYAPGLGSRA